MDRATVDAYEDGASHYAATRRPLGPPQSFARLGAVADLGCGPGWDLPALGPGAIGLDPARAMCLLAAGRALGRVVRAEAGALPLRRGALGAVWSAKALQHVPPGELPLALAEVHRVLPVDAPFEAVVCPSDPGGDDRSDEPGNLPGRLFACWDADELADVVHGAGFDPRSVTVEGPGHLRISATRARTLPDVVGPGMRLLLCGLNPSVYSADAGVGFARPGNRAWPALLAAGLATVDRDPRHLLRHHGIGMTDLVKRATAGADELTRDEYAAGTARLERTCARLRPGAVCLLGLDGWRRAVDRRATPGWQSRRLAGVAVYLMPNPSGRNARTPLEALVAHLRAALNPPG